MYIVGGGPTLDNETVFVERYDFEAGHWFQVADFPLQLVRPYVAVVNEKLYVLGGLDEYNETEVRDVFVYNDVADSWERRADMPDVCFYGSCTVLNSDIFIVGGDRYRTGKNMRYNTDTDQWSIIPNPVNSYDCGHAFELFGTVVLIHQDFRYIEQFDSVAKEWTEKHHFPFGVPGYDKTRFSIDPKPFEKISSAFKLCT
jgi:hypothetical protein